MDKKLTTVKPKIISTKRLQRVESTTQNIEPSAETDLNVVTYKDIIMDSFRFFDSLGNGHISCREYFNILLATRQFTEEEISLIIKESGLEINEKLDYKNFYEFWRYQ